METKHTKSFKPKLKLVGTDGNAFSLVGKAHQCYRENRAVMTTPWKEIQDEATSGDYDHLLQTLMKYFDVR